MGKKGSNRKEPESKATYGPKYSSNLTLREESKGKKPNVNAKSMLKLDHLKNLALWASSEEASIPQLAAFFGHGLASSSEALGVPSDSSLFTCQRCETILRPGYNCTVRIEKNKSKKRKRKKKTNIPSQNNVVYNCQFCSHKNSIRGTSRGYMKELYPQKTKTSSKQKLIEDPKKGIIVLPETPEIPETPILKPCGGATLFLDSMRKKRTRSGAKKTENTRVVTESTQSTESSKRRKKGWTSLKEIVSANEKGKMGNFANLSVPFLI